MPRSASARCSVCGITVPVLRARQAGGVGLSEAVLEVLETQTREREAQRAARSRVICGARTRKGADCRNKSEPGKQRCKFHGGMSTGPRTPKGRERIAEAQRLRWARCRDGSADVTRSS